MAGTEHNMAIPASTAAPASAKQPGDDPAELHPEIIALRAEAQLPKTLMGGTAAMVKAGEKYLPKMKAEDDETYTARLTITVLRNFYRQAIATLCGKLMRNGLKLDGTAKGPAEMADWLKDLDNCGTPGDVLFKRAFTWAIRDAAMWLLPTIPPTIKPDGSKINLAEERELAIRPYLIPLTIWDVLGWRTERVNGRHQVTQFRYMMHTEEPQGAYGSKTVEVIRVIEPTLIYDLKQNAKGEWERVDAPLPNTLGRVAINRIASDMDENLRPRGGMNDLADLNKEHWQLRSDQRLALRINSFPILFGAGMDALPPIGPEMGVTGPLGSELSYVESTGAALTAGRQELIDLEDAMRALGAQYVAKQVQRTATETSVDAQEANSPAQGWAVNAKRGFEAAMDDMTELAGKGSGSGSGGSLRVDTDALVASFDAGKLAELRAARATREISRETYLAQLKRWDVLPDDYDAEADQELIDQEPPEDLGGMNTPPTKKPAK